jgi:hypothetical protein
MGRLAVVSVYCERLAIRAEFDVLATIEAFVTTTPEISFSHVEAPVA